MRNEQNLILGAQHVTTGLAQGAGLQYFTVCTQTTGRGATQTTGDGHPHLGLVFDETYRGPGVKVAEILKRGPADKRGLNLYRGDIILSVDTVPLSPDTDLARALNDKVNETVVCEVSTPFWLLKKPRSQLSGEKRTCST